MLGRLRGSEQEDERYTEFLEGDSTPAVLGKVFLTQALARLLVSAPLQVAAASRLPRGPRRWLFPAGLAVMVAGAVVEATADRQKATFMAEQEGSGERRGRPRDPRHRPVGTLTPPELLRRLVVWDGAWLAAAASAPAAWTLSAPVAMSDFLVYATGAKRTEKTMEERESYRDYQRRVAFFVPLPRWVSRGRARRSVR